MSERYEFQPGDLIVDEDGSEFYVITHGGVGKSAVDADLSRWRLETIEGARRLVVIDPEDRDEVKRLYDLYYSIPGGTSAMQAALREFANPTAPRPDEPTGLGAVVEDAEGETWVRWTLVTEPRYAPWRNSDGIGAAAHTFWEHIDVVRVLSEGVTR